MAKRSVGMVSPNRAQGPKYPPTVKQGSSYNLTFDEAQSQMGNTGKPLHSMNLDELEKNVISAESEQLVQDPSFIVGNIGLNGTFSNKINISEAWRGIVHQEHVNGFVDTHLQQPGLGETTTLADFLACAGMIDVGERGNNVNVMGDTQSLMEIDPMAMSSQQEHWLQMQIPGINIHQHHQEQQHQQITGSCPDFNVSKTFYENMEIGYSENSVGISMSPAYSDSKSTLFGKNKYSDEMMEKTIERRQKRMAKNRESAARSRAKKQVSTQTRRACMRLVG